MSRNLRRALFAVIVIGLILPTFYIVASSLRDRSLGISLRDYQYTDATVAKPTEADIQAILSSLEQTINPENLTFLRDKLSGIAQFPASKDDPLADYIRTLSNFTDNMGAIDAKLQAARASIASGKTEQALAEVRQLNELRDRTRPLLRSLYSLLNRVESRYKIDTTNQLQKMNALDLLFQKYSKQIDQLSSKLKTQQGFTQTVLSLNASKQEVFIDEVFQVYGFLKTENGTALAGRNITIAWSSNQTVVRLTDFEGKFEADLSFPVGFPAGSTKIEATFEPEGSDKGAYLASSSFLRIQVVYRSSYISASIYPTIARPLNFVYVTGNLSTVSKEPLENRTIVMQLDGSYLGNTTTNTSGSFWFRFSVPRTLSNGTHTVLAIFNTTGDRVAPSNATLPFVVQLLQSEVLLRVDRLSLFSGMQLTVNGTISYVNTTYNKATAAMSGNVTVYVDEIPYGNATVNDDGSFVHVMQLPIGLSFGSHSIRVQYSPDEPWIHSSETATRIFVYNTPLIVLATIGSVTAVFSGTYLVRRNRRAALITAAPMQESTTLEEPVHIEELSRETLISEIGAEVDNGAKIRRAYALAQSLIQLRLGETPRESETPSEYLSRVTKTAPDIKDALERLVGLFELAEYSPYPIGSAQSREATEVLLKLREEIEPVK